MIMELEDLNKMARTMKRILDIKKISWMLVEVEYFDGASNSVAYTTRSVNFPSTNSYSGAWISWFGKKEIVEALYL